MKKILLSLFLIHLTTGCAVIAVADAGLTVASTAVSITTTVVGTAVDVTAAGVKAVIPD